MSFGVYVHIPYCLQRCTYCDFATYERSSILPSSDYVQRVLSEIEVKRDYYTPRTIDTLYFGGGTPSLLPPSEILSLIKGLEKAGFSISSKTEVTIEINPATVDPDKLKAYLDGGINRFSVGAQTFDDDLLKMVKREHNAKQTLETLELLRKHDVNFSFDLLFALPRQKISGVLRDLEIALEMGSKHLSPYCLTVPTGHPLSKGRAPEEEQVEMFEVIYQSLIKAGLQPYEISNFAKPGFESRHNLLYWTDEEFWGLGLSAHSYSRGTPWGTRFWNVNNIGEYIKQTDAQAGQRAQSPWTHLPEEQFETLEQHQALSDFCHTSLRLMAGLKLSELNSKFSPVAVSESQKRLADLENQALVQHDNGVWTLTRKGVLLSNQVFEKMTFLSSELPPSSH